MLEEVQVYHYTHTHAHTHIHTCAHIHTSIGGTVILVVVHGPGPRYAVVAECLATQTLGLDVEALGLVVGAEGGVVCEHGYVHPGGGVPVRVVVAFLWALVATPVPVGVLAGKDGRAHTKVVVAQVLVSGKEAWGRGRRERGGDEMRRDGICINFYFATAIETTPPLPNTT